VFYPRYFEIFNQVVEDWFSDALGFSFQKLHIEEGLGVPIVHAECDFLRPCRIGDVVKFSLAIDHLGEKSIRLSMKVTKGEELRLRALLTLVCVTLGDNLRGTPIPEVLRQAMAPYCLTVVG
jgi:4-hydroxybenzoyl-CoA thioesterase